MGENITLKLTRPMMRGSAVTRLQELGDNIGCDTGDNDGIFGPDTEKAVLMIQRKFDIKQDGICGPVTWRHLIDHIDSTPTVSADPLFFDTSGEHPHPKNYSRQRPASQVTGVTIHQTGCNMPQDPKGWDRLNAHVGITQEGKLIIVNDFTDMIWHAQGLSKTTIGIEFEGNFMGVDGKQKTLWRGGGGPHFLNPAMMEAANQLYILLDEWFWKNNTHWDHIYAHRQSSDMRRGDPGSEIWKAIALPWMDQRQGVEMDGGEKYFKGSGAPIPGAWNFNKYGSKY
jgi:hypothetical protein